MNKRHDAAGQRSDHALSPELYGGGGKVRQDEILAVEVTPAAAGEEALRKATTALVVVHGMGQQLEFQTLDEVERGLRRVDPVPRRDRTLGGILKVPGGKPIPRIELELNCPDDERTVPIHAYECYWASLTEGRVTLRDVLGFLWRAGYDGLRNAAAGFRRWIFGGFHALPVQKETAFWLNCAVIVLASLVALHAVIAAVGAARALGAVQPAEGTRAALTPALLGDLSLGMLLLLGLALVLWLGMRYLRWMGFFWALLAAVAIAGPTLLAVLGFHRWPRLHGALTELSPGWLAAILVALAAVVVTAWRLRRRQRLGAVLFRTVAAALVVLAVALVVAVVLYEAAGEWPVWTYFLLWGMLLLVSRTVRTLLVQYVGDVAVYVSPHRLDRFHELRDEIKGCVGKVVEAVFDAKDDAGRHRYQRVFVVGHSLGSVAAYDVVNRMLLVDALDGNRLAVSERLKLLLTFGSPLDKTAFLFRRQAKEDAVTREVLAAAVQPMIHDDSLRERIPWLNVHSRKDIISGPLDFYDDPTWRDGRPPRVENVEDLDANVPIEAHVQYWKNQLVFRRLHQAICAP